MGVLKLFLRRRVQQLLPTSRCRVKAGIVLLVRLRWRRVIGHLGQHPILHLELE